VNFAGIRPGVKLQSMKRSNQCLARLAEPSSPVAAAWAAKAIAAKLSL